VIFSCKEKSDSIYHPPVFPQDEEMVYEVVHNDLVMPNMVWFMDVYKDYLIMSYLDKKTGKWLHVHDKHTGERLASYLNQGRGPLEVTIPVSNHINHRTKEMAILGEAQTQLMLVDVDSLLNGKFEPRIIHDTIFEHTNLRNVFNLGDGKYLFRMRPGAIQSQFKRFVLYKDGQVLDRMDEYPLYDQGLMELNYDFYPALSPDYTKFAIGTSRGWILEYFDISDGIERTSTYYYYEPFWEENKTRIDTEKSGYGFMSMTADDKYIYSGSGEPGLKKINSITIFDWEGSPVKVLKTEDYASFYPIAVDRETGHVYAYVKHPEGEKHLIRVTPFPGR
jgi:hypothetical protein